MEHRIAENNISDITYLPELTPTPIRNSVANSKIGVGVKFARPLRYNLRRYRFRKLSAH